MKNSWVDNFYSYGSLTPEYVLFEYEGVPITFVCLDTKLKRYICHCTNPLDENSWLVSAVDDKELAEYIKEEKPLIDLLRNKSEIILALKEGLTIEYRVYQGDRLPEDELPAKDYSFKNDCEEYLKRITARSVIVPQVSSGQKSLMLPLIYKIHEGRDARPLKTKYSKVKRMRRNKKVLTG